MPGSVNAGAAKSATVTIRNISLQPDQVQIRAGQSVVWQFEDGAVPHSVTADDKSFDSGIQSSGELTHRFTQAGTYDDTSTVHPTRCRRRWSSPRDLVVS